MIKVLKEESIVGKTNIYATSRRQNVKSTTIKVLRLLDLKKLRNSRVLEGLSTWMLKL